MIFQSYPHYISTQDLHVVRGIIIPMLNPNWAALEEELQQGIEAAVQELLRIVEVALWVMLLPFCGACRVLGTQ